MHFKFQLPLYAWWLRPYSTLQMKNANRLRTMTTSRGSYSSAWPASQWGTFSSYTIWTSADAALSYSLASCHKCSAPLSSSCKKVVEWVTLQCPLFKSKQALYPHPLILSHALYLFHYLCRTHSNVCMSF